MTLAEPDGGRPWWVCGQELADEPSPTDVGAECGHTRDLHDSDGKCLVTHKIVKGGGNEKTHKSEPDAIIPPVDYVREECYCPGETLWYKAGLPTDGSWHWDPQTESIWRDPEARHTSDGKYVWWITPKKKNK